jgi:hypothetical protein
VNRDEENSDREWGEALQLNGGGAPRHKPRLRPFQSARVDNHIVHVMMDGELKWDVIVD